LISTGDKHHAIVHEWANSPCISWWVWSGLIRSWKDIFLMRKDSLADLVSEYATNNHAEFVAEVFAALLLGRAELKNNPRVMDLYERFGGIEIRRYDREAEECALQETDLED
jgi:hypothetical protein